MMKRYLSSAPIGLAVTLALLYAMHILIDTGNDVFVDPPTTRLPAWVGKIPQDESPVTVVPPPRIKDALDPPPLTPPTGRDSEGVPVHIPTGRHDPGPQTGIEYNVFNSDGPLVHMVRVRPNYPAIATSRGIEGFVTVRFDVTADGLAANVEIVESSHAVFNNAALRAARKFRFKPKIVDGQPIATLGVGYRFRFELDD